jgi:hypothetical protein
MMPGAALLVALLTQAATEQIDHAPAVAEATFRLDVRAPAECVSGSDIAARIAARTVRVHVGPEAALSARVVVTPPRAGSVVADLVLAGPGLEERPRRVVARSCAELADGIALIIAVTLDPTLTPGAAAGAAKEGAGAHRPNTAPKPQLDDSARAAAERDPSRVRPSPPPVARSEQAPAASPVGVSRRELGLTLAGQAVIGAAPSVMPGLALYGMAASERNGLWAPALFVGAMHVWRSDLSEAGGTASFSFDAASVDLCPIQLRWSQLVVRPCADGLVGRLSGRGSGVAQAASVARPFGVAGAAVAASFGARMVFSARLAVGATLIRHEYEFADNVFYRTAPLTISLSLGVGVAHR